MTIEELLRSRPELARETPENYFQHTNPNGNLGGWKHKTTIVGKGVFIGKGSVVMARAIMGDYSRMGEDSTMAYGSRMDDYSRMGNNSSIGEGSTMGYGSRMGNNSRMDDYTRMGEASTIGDGQFLNVGETLPSPRPTAQAASPSARPSIRKMLDTTGYFTQELVYPRSTEAPDVRR